MESGKNNPGNYGENPDSIWDRPSDWFVNDPSERKRKEQKKKRAEEEAKETKAKEEAKKKAEADKKSADVEEEKKKDEAAKKAAAKEENEQEHEEKEGNEERERKLAYLRQSILGVAAVGVMTRSFQKLWRLLQRRRKLEVTEDGRILTADDNDETIDLGRLTYAAQAEAEQPAERLPNTQISTDALDDSFRGEQTLGAEIPLAEEIPFSGEETLPNADFAHGFTDEIRGAAPDSLGDTLPEKNQFAPNSEPPKPPKSEERKPAKPWKFFGDDEERPSSQDQSKPPEKKPFSARQATTGETSPSSAEPSTISDKKAQEITEKLLKKLNSEEAKILRESSASREYVARLIRDKLGADADLKPSDLDRLSRLLRENLRKSVEQISATAGDSGGGSVAGGAAADGLSASSGGAAASVDGSGGVSSGSGATGYSGGGTAASGHGASGTSSAADGSNMSSDENYDGGESSASRSRSNSDNSDGKEVDWSSLAGDGSSGFSSPSYSPEFNRAGSDGQGSSNSPSQSIFSPSPAGSSSAAPAGSPGHSSAPNSAGGNSITGGNHYSSARGGFGSSAGGFGSGRAGAALTSAGSSFANNKDENENKESGKSAGRSLAMPPDFSGLTSLFGGFAGLNWRGQRSNLSQSGQRRAASLSEQIIPDLSKRSLESPLAKTEQRAMARDVGLLNALRELYLLAVAAGAVQPNETLIRPDVRQINETHDVRDDAARNQVWPAAPAQDDDQNDAADDTRGGATFDAMAFLAALIVLASFRGARSVVTDEESIHSL